MKLNIPSGHTRWRRSYQHTSLTHTNSPEEMTWARTNTCDFCTRDSELLHHTNVNAVLCDGWRCSYTTDEMWNEFRRLWGVDPFSLRSNNFTKTWLCHLTTFLFIQSISPNFKIYLNNPHTDSPVQFKPKSSPVWPAWGPMANPSLCKHLPLLSCKNAVNICICNTVFFFSCCWFCL